MTSADMYALSVLRHHGWSNKQLRRLGECLRDGTSVPDGHPAYDDVMIWYNDLAAAVQDGIRSLDWGPLFHGRTSPELTSRAKTIDTLVEKLRRDRATPLSSIQDIAGVRFECEMSLDEQDEVAARIALAFDSPKESIRDLRIQPHSGYRAVHIWLRLPMGRVEVQVRTHVQSQWANAYESLADWVGREIRYGAAPEDPEMADIVRMMQQLSLERGAVLETRRQNADALEREYGKRLATIDEVHQPGHMSDSELHALDRPGLTWRIAEFAQSVRAQEREYSHELERLEIAFRALKRGV